ncbi:AEC family transporter [Georgenia thermotolerans]|uniref:AEC family transporter n=1 Tax=Georgenia thermotolerans TaxID=527326 RepID=A0A7J5UJF6_9MICO|nr:AEC family transporter [Georgenia thermotolerans]KAE8762411.1 AEC family transporter [Georgenia thermotolerans]
MGAVLTGFVSLAVVVALGYVLGRFGILGTGADHVLSRLTFYAATPALMFLTVAGARVSDIFSAGALANVAAVAVAASLYALVARVALRRRGAEVTLGALSASYVNAGNLGIPILVFATGSAAAIAPILLLQLLVMVPVAFTVLDVQTGRRGISVGQVLLTPVRNPLVIGVALGLLFSVTGWRLPDPVLAPIEMLGHMAVPTMLIAFGLSLRGAPLPGTGRERGPLWAAVAIKTVVAPAVAYLLAREVLGLGGTELLATVIVAALPTAQNVFVYAMRYGRAVPLARDAILLSTLVCIPVVIALAGVLA